MADYEFSVIFVTAPDIEVADKIGKGLVEAKLAACVTRMSGAVSHYFWDGKLETEAEVVMIIKTRTALLSQVALFVKKGHPSKVPEIISLPIIDGEEAYLTWLGANTQFGKPSGKPNIAI